MWLRHQGYMFLSSTSGQYSLSSSSTYWTENFIQVNSAGNNPNNSSNVNLTSTANIANGDNIGLILDNNTLQWTTVANVVNTTTVTVSNTLTFSMNNKSVVYAFDDSAQPPQSVDWINLRDQNGNDTFIDNITYEQFVSLPSKQSQVYQGDPTCVYVESHLVGNQPYVYINTDVNGVIDLTKYLVINYTQELSDWVNETDQPDFEKQWYEALVFNLAKRLSPFFNSVWTKTQDDLAREAWLVATSADPRKLSYSFSRRNGGGYPRNPPHR